MSDSWNKAQIVNRLAAAHGYRHYLELCAVSTGWRYGEIDRERLSCRRLMYLASGPRDDGLPIDYSSASRDIGPCLAQMAASGFAFEVALVDPWHEYETSWRDMNEAFRLLPEGGSLVVHDCLPPRAEIACSSFREGEWCGVTYQAFIDFVHGRDDLDFFTVDCDYGCGVIRKRKRRGAISRLVRRLRRKRLLHGWRAARGAGDDEAFAYFQANGKALLNLVSAETFASRHRGMRSR